MPKCIAVFCTAALNLLRSLLRALLAPSQGRHRHRPVRHRSRRVRPFAPVPDGPLPPARSALPAPALPAPDHRDHAQRTPARTTLNAPTTQVPADEVALVRPYYTAHENDLAQQRALVRLRAWGADLPDPAEARKHTTRAYTLDEYASHAACAHGGEHLTADAFHVPAPRAHTPRMSTRVDDLPHLSRLRRAQQERRSQGQKAGLSGVTV